jgi:hypothetical protein
MMRDGQSIAEIYCAVQPTRCQQRHVLLQYNRTQGRILLPSITAAWHARVSTAVEGVVVWNGRYCCAVRQMLLRKL